MLAKKITLSAVAASLVLGATAAYAQDNGALLDLLVRKRLINDQEAEEVRAELIKESTTTSAGKLKLSTPVTELEIYGDARVRYEVRSGETARPDPVNKFNDTVQRNRSRYRLRLGLRGTLSDDWFFGIRLETSSNPRSTNVTFGDDTSTASAGGGGPFSKGSDGINVGQAYLGYRGIPGLTLIAGRQPNPLITTPMVWDGDINPEGLSESYKYTFTVPLGGSGGGAEVAGNSKDGKGTVSLQAETPARSMTIDVFANFAQFVYDDSNPENPLGVSPKGVPNTDAFLLAWQAGAKFNFTKDVYFQIAPTLYNYTGTGDTFNTTFIGDPTFKVTKGKPPVTTSVVPNQTGVNNLLVLEVPAEFGFKALGMPMRAFGDFAYNFNGGERATAAGHPEADDQRYAYQIGLGIGKIKGKGDFAVSGYWQHTDQFALDPNLVDSDIFDSRVNMEGIAITAGYGITDAITANLTYGYGQQIDHRLGTGGIADAIGINPLDKYQIFQADLNVKF